MLLSTTKELEDEERIRDLSAPLIQWRQVENEEFIYSLNSSWDTSVTLVAYIPHSPTLIKIYAHISYTQVSLSNLALRSP